MPGQPSMMRTIRWRDRWMSRPGAWKMPQRRALGRALRHSPSKQSSWNQRTRSADMATAIIQLVLASKLVNGKRHSPESFKRCMWRSTWAWARMVASRSTGSPSWSV